MCHACDALYPSNAKARRQAMPGGVQSVRWQACLGVATATGCQLNQPATGGVAVACPGVDHAT